MVLVMMMLCLDVAESQNYSARVVVDVENASWFSREVR